MDGLVDTETTGEYPSRFDPTTLAFPPVDAPVWTLATESTGTVTDGTLDTVTPVVDEAALPADATTRLPTDSMRSLFTTSAPINSYPALGLFGVLPTLAPSPAFNRRANPDADGQLRPQIYRLPYSWRRKGDN